ncbi:MAG: N-formylglutamate amidohydrolase [Planctomycetes bacterium]|nr:N-formylglutamate amidohydrolase [Planctomycetota bacterium]
MKLPLIISVPHAGLTVPEEARDYCALTPEQIIADSDEGAAEIYDLKSEVTVHITTDVARAIVDMNRAEDDRGRDGIVKTHTCYNARVYHQSVPEDVAEILLERYYRPYHRRLSESAADAKFGVDCHTMVAVGPPSATDSDCERPNICLSNAHGTCPQNWFEKLTQCFKESFDSEISVNHPFKGGYIIRSHSSELPWVQVELSRAPFLQIAEKRERVLQALTLFWRMVLDV